MKKGKKESPIENTLNTGSTVVSNNTLISSGSTTFATYTSNSISGATGPSGFSWYGNNITHIPPSSKYYILGKYVKFGGFKDLATTVLITHINLSGISYWVEFKKQFSKKDHLPLPKEIVKFLDEEIVSYNRNKSIEEIIS